MTQLGELKLATELGWKAPPVGKGPILIWHACVDCGKERWVLCRAGKQVNDRCRTCANQKKNLGSKSHLWHGGITYIGRHHQYKALKLPTTDFFYSMVGNRGYVMEHRLIMAKHLGRCLHQWEIVHHKNGDYTDNRIENLQLVTDERHKQITILENKIKKLERDNESLRTQLAQTRM